MSERPASQRRKPSASAAPARRRRVETVLTEEAKAARAKEEKEQQIAQSKELVLASLRKNFGLIAVSLRQVRVQKHVFDTWVAQDLDFRASVEEIAQYQADVVESKLLTKINEGDTKAIMFYLLNKGRSNGYIPHHYHRPDPQQLALVQSSQQADPAASQIAADRSEIDDDGLLEAMRIAQERNPSVFDRQAKKPIIIEAE